MKLREIRTGLLVKKSIAYRIIVIITQIIFMWCITRNLTFSVSVSLLWNVINTIEYFGFDYVFLRIYKVGRNGK